MARRKPAPKPQPHFNTAGTHVWLHNPETDGFWECPEVLVDVYVSARGWELTEPPSDEETPETPAEPDDQADEESGGESGSDEDRTTDGDD